MAALGQDSLGKIVRGSLSPNHAPPLNPRRPSGFGEFGMDISIENAGCGCGWWPSHGPPCTRRRAKREKERQKERQEEEIHMRRTADLIPERLLISKAQVASCEVLAAFCHLISILPSSSGRSSICLKGAFVSGIFVPLRLSSKSLRRAASIA